MVGPFLAGLCFLLYSLAPIRSPSGDTVPTLALPFSILVHRTFTLDWVQDGVGTPSEVLDVREEEPLHRYYLHVRDGRFYSAYSPATPLLLLPIYALILPVLAATGFSLDLPLAVLLGQVAASLVAALGVAVMYELLLLRTSQRLAFLLAIAFALGTSQWSTSSRELWQHGPGVLFLLLTLLSIQKNKPFWLGGIFAATAVAIRPLNVLFWMTCIFVLSVTRRNRPQLAAFALPGIATGAAMVGYNLWLFGHPFGFYGGQLFDSRPLEGFAGLLFNPSRGLLVFSPFLFAGVVGIWRHARPSRPILLIAAVFTGLHLLTLSSWWAWFGGDCFGPRMLTESAAMLVVLAGPVLESLRRSGWLAFGLALTFSVFAHGIGAHRHRASAWEQARHPTAKPEALWSLRNSQILFFLRN